MTAAEDNQKLKRYVSNFINTDVMQELRQVKKENELVKKKYSGLVKKYNENAKRHNDLLEENKTLKGHIKDLTNEISSIYKSTKSFLKERTDGLKAFKNVFNDLVNKVKEKSPKGEFERLNNAEKSREIDNGMGR